MKYKVGDFVRVKSWESLCESAKSIELGVSFCTLFFERKPLFPCWCFVDDMKKYCGNTYEIMEITEEEPYFENSYILEGCLGNFTDNMVELAKYSDTKHNSRCKCGKFKKTENVKCKTCHDRYVKLLVLGIVME